MVIDGEKERSDESKNCGSESDGDKGKDTNFRAVGQESESRAEQSEDQ